ncbi:TPA: hypothetical protein ACH3X3_005405 [Trebouxia sp. C0006]
MNILPTLNMQAYVIACSLQITKDLSAQLWSLFETFQPQCAHSAWLEDPSGTRKRTETPATQRDLPKQGSAKSCLTELASCARASCDPNGSVPTMTGRALQWHMPRHVVHAERRRLQSTSMGCRWRGTM